MNVVNAQSPAEKVSAGESVDRAESWAQPSAPVPLAEFLLARIAEDEEVAWGGAPSPWTAGVWDGRQSGPREVLERHGDVTATCFYGGTYGHVLRFDPTRVLAECKAKRAIIEGCRVNPITYTSPASHSQLRVLAAVYADHADFDPAWKLR